MQSKTLEALKTHAFQNGYLVGESLWRRSNPIEASKYWRIYATSIISIVSTQEMVTIAEHWIRGLIKGIEQASAE